MVHGVHLSHLYTAYSMQIISQIKTHAKSNQIFHHEHVCPESPRKTAEAQLKTEREAWEKERQEAKLEKEKVDHIAKRHGFEVT